MPGVSVSKRIFYGNSNLHLQHLYQGILKFEVDIYTYDKLVNKILENVLSISSSNFKLITVILK